MKKFNSIDLFKFLMAIVVVAFHTNPFVNCENVLINEIVINIADVSVPFFFIASGYLFAERWGDTCQKREKYVQKMLCSSLQLYVIWTLFSLPLTLYGYAMSGNSVVSCVFSYVKYFVFVGTLYNSYHLWYLLAMIYAWSVMWILIHKGKGTQHILLTGVVLYAIYLLFMWIRQSDSVNGVLTAISNIFYFVFNDGGVFVGMLYISFGICVRACHKADLLVSVAGIVAGVWVKYNLSRDLGIIVTAVMLFVLVTNIKLPDHSCYIMLRNLSKYIYLSHLLCFSFYTFIIIGQPNKLGIDSFLMTFVLSIVVSVIIIYLKGLFKKKDKRIWGNV